MEAIAIERLNSGVMLVSVDFMADEILSNWFLDNFTILETTTSLDNELAQMNRFIVQSPHITHGYGQYRAILKQNELTGHVQLHQMIKDF